MVVCTLSEVGVSEKKIMAYTGHKSSSSLVHYDNLNAFKSKKISSLLVTINDINTDRYSPPPVLVASPRPVHLT